jgi:hypothetical protein
MHAGDCKYGVGQGFSKFFMFRAISDIFENHEDLQKCTYQLHHEYPRISL